MLEVHAAQVHVLGTARDAEQEQARWARRRQPALAVGRRCCRHPLGLPVARSGSASGSEEAACPWREDPWCKDFLPYHTDRSRCTRVSWTSENGEERRCSHGRWTWGADGAPRGDETALSSLASWMMRVGTPAAVILLRAEDCEGPHGVLRLGGVMGRSPRGSPHSYAADEDDAGAGGAEKGFQAGHAASLEVGPGTDWWTSLSTCCSWRSGVAPALEEEAPNHTKHSGRPDLGADDERDARAAVGRSGLRRRRREGCGYSEEAAPREDWDGSRVPEPERGRPVEAVPTMDDVKGGSLGTDRYVAPCPVRSMGTDRYEALCPVAQHEEAQEARAPGGGASRGGLG